MPNSISIQVTGLNLAIASLSQIPFRVDTWSRELQRDIGLIVQSEVDEVFNSAPGVRSSGSVYNGETWDELTEAYLKARPIREGGQQLRDTGELLQSLQVGGGGNVLTSDSDSITFGSNLPKARGLQNKRPFLVATETMAELVAKAIARYFELGI